MVDGGDGIGGGENGMTLPRNIRRSSELWMEAQGNGRSLAGEICMYICMKDFMTGLIGEYSHELTRCSADKSGIDGRFEDDRSVIIAAA